MLEEYKTGVWDLSNNLEKDIEELHGMVELCWYDWREANHLIDTFSERLKREMGHYTSVGYGRSRAGMKLAHNKKADKSLVKEETELLRMMIDNLKERFYASTQTIVLKGVFVPGDGIED